MVDERYDLRSLPKLVVTFECSKICSWTLAAASYNGGMAGVNRQMEMQKRAIIMIYFYRRKPAMFLNFGIKEIMKNQISLIFVYEGRVIQSVPTKKIEVDSSVSMADFAKARRINYKIKNSQSLAQEKSWITAVVKNIQ
jgi:hypothetical protein